MNGFFALALLLFVLQYLFVSILLDNYKHYKEKGEFLNATGVVNGSFFALLTFLLTILTLYMWITGDI